MMMVTMILSLSIGALEISWREQGPAALSKSTGSGNAWRSAPLTWYRELEDV